MDVAEIEERIAQIEAIGYADPEVGHSKEDQLWEDVLQAIADGPKGAAKELAYAALGTRELYFPRWYN